MERKKKWHLRKCTPYNKCLTALQKYLLEYLSPGFQTLNLITWLCTAYLLHQCVWYCSLLFMLYCSSSCIVQFLSLFSSQVGKQNKTIGISITMIFILFWFIMFNVAGLFFENDKSMILLTGTKNRKCNLNMLIMGLFLKLTISKFKEESLDWCQGTFSDIAFS